MQPALPLAGERLAEVRCSFPRQEQQHQRAPDGIRGSRGLWFSICLLSCGYQKLKAILLNQRRRSTKPTIIRTL